MLRDRVLARLGVVLVLTLVVVGTSACYRNAGENVQPTSNRVDLSDIEPTAIPATATPTVPLPTAEQASPVPPKATLAPSETPSPESIEPQAVPSVTPLEPTSQPTLAPSLTPQQALATATTQSLLAPTFTPLGATSTPSGPVITTPGMSDIRPTSTPAPTLNPALQPTPTSLPAEENPCIHIVMPGDTLYSIAQDNEVLLTDLVAANPALLGGSENTPLQVGWQLNLPGCTPPGATPVPTAAPLPAEGEQPIQVEPGAPQQPPVTGTTYTVQSGDTAFSIARRFGVSLDALIAANNLVVRGNVVYLTVGQQLVIPAP